MWRFGKWGSGWRGCGNRECGKWGCGCGEIFVLVLSGWVCGKIASENVGMGMRETWEVCEGDNVGILEQ